MAAIIQVTDLPESVQSAELVQTMVDGANAKASRVAPCLASTDPAPSVEQLAEAKLVLIGAIKRWVEAGTGSFTQQTAGPFSVSTDSRQRSGYNLRTSEIQGLQAICSTGPTGREAFSINTAPTVAGNHALWCSLYFGATYCSCGADIAGEPIFEQG